SVRRSYYGPVMGWGADPKRRPPRTPSPTWPLTDERTSLRSPCRAARSGLKMGVGCPLTSLLSGPFEVVG
ncbi:MAG: hypothetical protein LC799_31680, partial [Actinobacteria bacterium]|nr:hypothetical protein [Actinomycetota bacterium]